VPTQTNKHNANPIRLGIDVGGTFTDIVCCDVNGDAHITKVPTRLDSIGQTSLRPLIDSISLHMQSLGYSMDGVERVEHATTLATNAIIERTGARTAMVTTAGFRDFLEAGHELLYELYNLNIELPEPLVPRRDRIAFPERVRADGQVERVIDEVGADRLVEVLRSEKYESVAICFLHSPTNPSNERALGSAITTALPDLSVTLSSDVVPEIGEYPRFSTATIDAYIKPLILHYLSEMNRLLRREGLKGELGVTLSNGGSNQWQIAAHQPSRMVESGPAAGIVALRALQDSGRISDAVLTFEMGGTTAKLCFLRSGRRYATRSLEVGRTSRFKPGSGLTIAHPSIDLLEIGSGGGSIASYGEDGLLHVGPDSAGSNPGPACYAFGGKHPTVTDANLLLGYLLIDSLGDSIRLDRAAAESAIATDLEPLGLDPVKAAAAIYRIVVENMALAVRVAAAERGLDVRSFQLVACGGAGPMHAAAVARTLGMSEIVVPECAGVISSLGCLLAPRSHSFLLPVRAVLDSVQWDEVQSNVLAEVAEARARGSDSDISENDRLTKVSVDMRYVGQRRNRLEVPVPKEMADPLVRGQPLPIGFGSQLREAFELAYVEQFGRLVRGGSIEVVSLDVTIEAASTTDFPRLATSRRPLSNGGQRTTQMYFDWWGSRTGWVHSRASLPVDGLQGPGMVVDPDTTVVVPPDFHARTLESLVVLTRSEGQGE
jgi:N-methylhydantoinase A